MSRPAPTDCPPAFQAYVDRVPDGDVLQHLARQAEASAALLARVPAAREGFAYAAGKWSIRRVWQHVVDGERLFAYRALCIARGETRDLPPFDEDAYAAQDGSCGRRLGDVLEEYAAVRRATLLLFAGFDGAAWQRVGTANGKRTAVRSLPWIVAGHELHHLAVLRERYGVA
ncbi:MAG: DinB family protein [Planctomycetes bacterium]|nr:DinB family protein [Planctomycetota bacterium]